MPVTWRLIDSGPCGAAYSMALDEAIATAVRTQDSPPTLRLYGWDRTSLSLGCFQKTSDLDLAYCRQQSIPVVRRPTGGRAILHEEELTYSFSVRTDLKPFAAGLLPSYRAISAAFNLAFHCAGIPVESKKERERGSVLARSPLCFGASSYGEIQILGKKIVGSAQKRWRDGMLQQGSIPYVFDRQKMQAVFGKEGISHTAAHMAALKEIIPDMDAGIFRKTVVRAFEDTFGVSLQVSHPSREELLLAEELEQQKYLQDSWNLRL